MTDASLGLLRDYAMRFVGMPYLWGGKSPPAVDCSGLVNILLHPFGMSVPGANAQHLFDHFSQPENHASTNAELGAVVFYGDSPQRIDHVAIALNALRMIEAGGGGPEVTSVSIAERRGAYVKLAPIYEARRQGIFLPHYSEIETP